MKRIKHWINGELVNGKSDRTGPVFNPALGEQISEVLLASDYEVDDAVKAAKKAFPEWSSLPAIRRARIMFRFNELLMEHADELAELITSEHGKTIEDSLGDIMRGREVVEFSCGIIFKQYY